MSRFTRRHYSSVQDATVASLDALDREDDEALDMHILTGQPLERPAEATYLALVKQDKYGELAECCEVLPNTKVLHPNDHKPGMGKKNVDVPPDRFAFRKKEQKPGDSSSRDEWQLLGEGVFALRTKPKNPDDKPKKKGLAGMCSSQKPGEPHQQLTKGTIDYRGTKYVVMNLQPKSRVAFLIEKQKTDKGNLPRRFVFFGQASVHAINVDHCEVTADEVDRVNGEPAEDNFQVFRVRRNCIACFTGVDGKQRLVGDCGIYVLRGSEMKEVKIYDFNRNSKAGGRINYGDELVQAMRLDWKEWTWWFAEEDLAGKKSLAASKRGLTIVSDKSAMLPVAKGKGIHIIFDAPDCKFHVNEHGLPLKFGAAGELKTELLGTDDYGNPLFSKPTRWFMYRFESTEDEFNLVRIEVPQTHILYYVENLDPCVLFSLSRQSVEDLVDVASIRAVMPSFSAKVAFIRCDDGLAFYSESDGRCVTCEHADGQGLTKIQLEEFDAELMPGPRPRDLVDREVERIGQIVGCKYYEMDKPQKLVGDTRPREFIWSSEHIRIFFDDDYITSLSDRTFAQFLLFELPPNTAAIVGPAKDAGQFKTLDGVARSKGLVQYAPGFVALNMLTSRLHGVWPTTNMDLRDEDKPFYAFVARSADGLKVTVEVTASYYISNPIQAIGPYIGGGSNTDDNPLQPKSTVWFEKHISKDLKPIISNAFSDFIRMHNLADLNWELTPHEAKVKVDVEDRAAKVSLMKDQIKRGIDEECKKRGLALHHFLFSIRTDKEVQDKLQELYFSRLERIGRLESIGDEATIADAEMSITKKKIDMVGEALGGPQGMLHHKSAAAMTTNTILQTGTDKDVAMPSITNQELHLHQAGSDQSNTFNAQIMPAQDEAGGFGRMFSRWAGGANSQPAKPAPLHIADSSPATTADPPQVTPRTESGSPSAE